jgi:hypothetical protein
MAKGLGLNMPVNDAATADFVMRLLHSATNAHILHLQSTSFSQHSALGEYYENIVGLTDSLVEVYQARGIIMKYPSTFTISTEPIEYMMYLKEYVASNREMVAEESYIQNIIDEIAALIDRTIYKLRFLK